MRLREISSANHVADRTIVEPGRKKTYSFMEKYYDIVLLNSSVLLFLCYFHYLKKLNEFQFAIFILWLCQAFPVPIERLVYLTISCACWHHNQMLAWHLQVCMQKKRKNITPPYVTWHGASFAPVGSKPKFQQVS